MVFEQELTEICILFWIVCKKYISKIDRDYFFLNVIILGNWWQLSGYYSGLGLSSGDIM